MSNFSPGQLLTAAALNAAFASTLAPDSSGNISVTGNASIGGNITANVLATNSTNARSLSDRFGEVLNIKDLKGPSDADYTNALNAAFTYAAANSGTVIYFPSGTYAITVATATDFIIPSHTTIRGSGMFRTQLTWNDSSGFALFGGTGSARTTDIIIEDIGITGTFSASNNNNAYPIVLSNVDYITVRHVCIQYSRAMGMAFRGCTELSVHDCVVRYVASDGISGTQCAQVTIKNNSVAHTSDDAISAHSNPTDPWGVRKNIVISGNRVFDCQGIKVLGARHASIVNNVLDCVRSQGISVATQAAGSTEGLCAAISITITGNSITNLIKRNNIDNLNQGCPGISITGYSARQGSLAAIPGEADTANAIVVDPYKAFASNSTATTMATSGSYGVIVSGNTIMRNLPPCNGTVTGPNGTLYSKFSDYGFGSIFTVSGWWDGSLATTDFQDYGIVLAGGVIRDVTITDNYIRGLQGGLSIGTTGSRFENIVFRDNQIVDCTDAGVTINDATATVRCYVEGNIFDLDPFLVHANRGANGTWLASGSPVGVFVQSSAGALVRRNVFRNLCRDVDKDSSAVGTNVVMEANTIEADPATSGSFSTSNKGVGLMRRAGGTTLVQAGSDPASTNFGKILTFAQDSSNAVPASGTWVQGTFVKNTAPAIATGKVLLGWVRLTTGTGNVSGTDWSPIYGTTS